MLLSAASFSWISLSRRSRAGRHGCHYRRDGPAWPRFLLDQPRLHVFRRCHFRLCAHPPRPYSAGSLHRHRLCRGLRYGILLMSKATGETEHLTHMLVGNILAVSKPEVIKTRCSTAVSASFTSSFARIPAHLHGSQQGRADRPQRPFLGFSLLRFFRICGHLVGGHRGVLLVFCYLIVPALAPCSLPTASARASPSVGPWEHWSLRWSLSKREA